MFIFVDPNMGSPPLKFHKLPQHSEAAEIPIRPYKLERDAGFLGKRHYPAYWDDVPLKEYTGIQEVVDSPLLADALSLAGAGTPFKVFDGGCPGTWDHEDLINEGEFYAQLAL